MRFIFWYVVLAPALSPASSLVRGQTYFRCKFFALNWTKLNAFHHEMSVCTSVNSLAPTFCSNFNNRIELLTLIKLKPKWKLQFIFLQEASAVSNFLSQSEKIAELEWKKNRDKKTVYTEEWQRTRSSQTWNEEMWKICVSWVRKWLCILVKKAESFSSFHYIIFTVGCFSAAQNHFTTRAPSSNCSIFHTVATAVKYLNFQTYSISIHFSVRRRFFFSFHLFIAMLLCP